MLLLEKLTKDRGETTMKKILSIVSILVLCLGLVACGSEEKAENVLTVAATLDPHSKILEAAAPILLEDYGIELEVTVLDDYYIINKSVDDGEVDANYFQHIPFFESDVSSNGYDLVNAGGIHIEPFGIYSQNYSDVSEVEEGATVVISNSISDNGRILSILASAGLIILPEDIDILDLTIQDISDEYNPYGLEFIEIKPELLTLAYDNNEGDLVAINGNYAIQGGLNPTSDALILEDATQDNPYINIIAVKSENIDDEKIVALVEVLQSDVIQEFITSTYSDGSVIPAISE